MATFIKKENLTISIGEYQNNNNETKQEWRTIGELITMQGNDGPYQFFKLWGAGGAVEGKVFEQQDRTNTQNNNQQQPQNNQQQAPQQAPQQQQYQQQPNNYQG
jgi:hypothetical protein